MAFNLIRNARVFFTRKVDTYGVVTSGIGPLVDFSDNETFEIQVLDGLSFSQNTTTETVTLNEAGDTPNRGQRNFNTALEPVDFSFSTYIRPRDIVSASGSVNVDAEEKVLWNAMFGYGDIGATGAAWTASTLVSGASAGPATVALTNSNKNQLLPFGMIICFDDSTFVIDNCVMDSATVDFGLDTIAAIQWAGKASAIRQFDKTTLTDGTTTVTASSAGSSNTIFIGTALKKVVDAPYLANKLSTLTLFEDISGATTSYSIALTGGSLTLANNVTYLTPANLGVVNKPITYFTGTRAISGSINAYLRTGSGSATALLNSILTKSLTDVNPAFNVKLSMGGNASAPTRVDLVMPACVLQVPTVATEQVISTTIGFTAQGRTGTAFDIGSNNEIEIRYYVADKQV